MAGTYLRAQKIHALSFMTNSAFGLSFPSPRNKVDCDSGYRALQSYVTNFASVMLNDSAIQEEIGKDWSLVWGPVVFVNDPTSISVHADNTMALYYSSVEKLFVIGIAGTNVNSPFGWISEDVDVHHTIPWEQVSGKENTGHISKGTYIGLKVLLGMKNDQGVTMLNALKNYIEQQKIDHAEVAVSGHSLGGALAPTLALYMLDHRSEWTENEEISLSTYPTAGATPGDFGFKTYYESQIHAKKITYDSRYNRLDIVPMAWNRKTLASIPTLYSKQIGVSYTIGNLCMGASLNALAAKNKFGIPINQYEQINPWNQLNGEFNQQTDQKITKKLFGIWWVVPSEVGEFSKEFKNTVRFLAQAGYQHTTAYLTLLDIEKAITRYQALLEEYRPDFTTLKTAQEMMLEGTIGVNLNRFDGDAMALAEDNPEMD